MNKIKKKNIIIFCIRAERKGGSANVDEKCLSVNIINFGR